MAAEDKERAQTEMKAYKERQAGDATMEDAEEEGVGPSGREPGAAETKPKRAKKAAGMWAGSPTSCKTHTRRFPQGNMSGGAHLQLEVSLRGHLTSCRCN
jgi:hypothetical protein